MDSLANYGSDDDDLDEAPEESRESPEEKAATTGARSRTDDTNYDEVQMSLSEGSDQEGGAERRPRGPRRRSGSGARHQRDRNRPGGDDERTRQRSRSRERYRKERRRSRSPRDRRRSRSPRNRSRSRGRYPKRYERPGGRSNSSKRSSEQPPQQSNEQQQQQRPSGGTDDKRTTDRFFMPGITGRFRDQIEKRKLLWQKKKEPEERQVTAAPKVWETTTFAQDQDGKVANKFKRLMGIRSETGEGTSGQGELLKKQEEMFTSMEAQYEVARTATHTMRGVGLGFGSYQR